MLKQIINTMALAGVRFDIKSLNIMEPTTQEWLELLPYEIADKAVANASVWCTLETKRNTLKQALQLAFAWGKTPEGYQYWETVCNKYC
jgi:hypothetical protein